MAEKYVYFFGPKGTEGDASMKNTLGGKGANLAEMAKLGLPVPAGFTITTDCCNVYLEHGKKFTDEVKKQVADALSQGRSGHGHEVRRSRQNPLLGLLPLRRRASRCPA